MHVCREVGGGGGLVLVCVRVYLQCVLPWRSAISVFFNGYSKESGNWFYFCSLCALTFFPSWSVVACPTYEMETLLQLCDEGPLSTGVVQENWNAEKSDLSPFQVKDVFLLHKRLKRFVCRYKMKTGRAELVQGLIWPGDARRSLFAYNMSLLLLIMSPLNIR